MTNILHDHIHDLPLVRRGRGFKKMRTDTMQLTTNTI